MTALRLLSVFLVLALASAFAPGASRFGMVRSVVPPSSARSPLAMASDPKGLEEVQETSQTVMESSSDSSDEETTKEPTKAVYRNLARGGEVTEVPWVDPAMAANTNPFEMSWWAYILFGLPVMLLCNDFLHFIPTEGPLAFLNTI